MTRFRFAGSASRSSVAIVLGGALLLAACQSKPTGQVAAKVDGDEITTTELNTELAGVQVPKGADAQALQRQALQRVIDRKVLANAARQDNLDQSPEFIIRRQQLEDALLVQLLTQKVARGLKAPTAMDADKFMADNPSIFAGRAILSLDQLRFPPPPNADLPKQLGGAHTMADVIAVLDRAGIKYQRGNAQLDTAQLPPAVATQISKLPSGEPFVIPANGVVTVSVITGSKPAPLGGDAVRPLAMNGVRQTRVNDAMMQRLKTEKASAKIEYQPGFAPTGNADAPGAAATPK